MKKVALVYCKEALLGIHSPLSFLTEAILSRAVSSLQNGKYEAVYIAINHLRTTSHGDIVNYLDNLLQGVDEEGKNRIYVSDTFLEGYESLIMLISQMQHEKIGVDILAPWIEERREISKDISANLFEISGPQVFLRV